MQGSLGHLTQTFAENGRVRWIGVRPERRAPVVEVENAEVLQTGIAGDRRKTPGRRAVTLIQW